jgi:hypothetical protein
MALHARPLPRVRWCKRLSPLLQLRLTVELVGLWLCVKLHSRSPQQTIQLSQKASSQQRVQKMQQWMVWQNPLLGVSRQVRLHRGVLAQQRGAASSQPHQDLRSHDVQQHLRGYLQPMPSVIVWQLRQCRRQQVSLRRYAEQAKLA